MKKLECSQDFSHYKFMGIFPGAQGQLTPGINLALANLLNASDFLEKVRRNSHHLL